MFLPDAGFVEFQPGAQRLAGHRAATADQRDGGDAPPQAAGVPAENRIRLSPVHAPLEAGRECQLRRTGRCGIWPGQGRAGAVEFGAHVGTEMEGEADAVTAADLIHDVDAAGGAVKRDGAPVLARWAQPGVAVV